jgi:hypothetical protein
MKEKYEFTLDEAEMTGKQIVRNVGSDHDLFACCWIARKSYQLSFLFLPFTPILLQYL